MTSEKMPPGYKLGTELIRISAVENEKGEQSGISLDSTIDQEKTLMTLYLAIETIKLAMASKKPPEQTSVQQPDGIWKEQ